MLVDATNSQGTTVASAIRQAASATGTSFNYLLATAQVESGLNPQAGASTTSARGLFQFIEQTWLATMKDSGAGLGYGRYANAITKTDSGRYVVQDPTMRSQILKLRNDPTANATMAGAFTKANAAALTARLGRAPNEGELYLAHFLGAGGAGRLISLSASQPGASAANFFPGAAKANPTIFYDSKGNARSLSQVTSVLTGRFDVARAKPLAPSATPQAANVVPQSRAAAPDTAGITNAFAAAVPIARADDTDVFHGLFQDPNRRAPVAPVVSQLWGIAGGKDKASSGSTLDLFKDGPTDASGLFGNKS
jgi:Transglycosylase SLT domain